MSVRNILTSSHAFRILIIIIIGLLAYSNTFHAGFTFDDVDSINLNKDLTNFSGTGGYGYFLQSRRGVALFSFFLNYHFGGFDVFGYHLVNIAIHLAAALLVYGLVLTAVRASNGNEPEKHVFADPGVTAFFTALLFVSHPIQTQAVTYIVQRFTSLCTMFYLAGILCYAVARQASADSANGKQQSLLKVWGLFALSLLFAGLAAKTKEIAFTFPLMVLIYEFTFFRAKPLQRMKYLLLPVAVPIVFACFFLFKALMQSGAMGLDEITRVQTNISRLDYLFTQFRVIHTYIRLIFFPINQSVEYDYPVSTAFSGEVALSALSLGLILLTAVWLLIRSNRAQVAIELGYLRMVAFGIIWFFVTLSIESSFFPIIDVIFEHRLYLPSVGTMISITALIMYAATKVKHRENALRIVTVTFFVLTLILAYATYKRNMVWADDLTLWRDAYQKAPRNYRVANNYAAALIVRGRGEAALPLLISSIEIYPGYTTPWTNLARAFDQMPELRGRYWKGSEMLKPDGSVDPLKLTIWYSFTMNSLGLAYQLQNNVPKAFECYRKSLEINPSFSLARDNALSLISTMPDKAQSSHYLVEFGKIPQ